MIYISRNECAVVHCVSGKITPSFYFKQMWILEGRNKNSVCTVLRLISIFEVIRTLFRHNLAQDLFIKCFSIHLPVSYIWVCPKSWGRGHMCIVFKLKSLYFQSVLFLLQSSWSCMNVITRPFQKNMNSNSKVNEYLFINKF